jgi:amino acid adenylation domain-containing protein
VQVVAPAGPVELRRLELDDAPAGEREARVGELAREEALAPFDLGRGPLLRAALLRLDDAEHVLLFTLHHVVSDGWSTGVLVREVSELYGAFSEGREPGLPELPVQYADYAAWQRAHLQGETLEAQLAYWRERLGGAPPLLEVPTDRPRSAATGERGRSRPFTLSAGLVAGLRELGRAEGATPYMVLLAAWQLLLAKYSGQEDVVVGSPIAGRTRTELEGVIGFFANTLALRTDLSGDPAFRELLGRVREGVVGAQAHQEVPFERVVDELGIERSLTHTPLFQAMFAYQNTERGELRMGALEAEPVGGGAELAPFDLTLSLFESPGALAGSLVYRAELWEDAGMERLLEHFRVLLEAVAAEPGRRVSELELLGGAERARVLEEWNATAAELPAERCVHALFAEHAARNPGAPALVGPEEALSYGELEARANRLARHLRGLGVGPEAVVGVCLERSPELVEAVLGVLKAGGAYLPLDPSYPAERLAYMVRDAEPRVLITREGLVEQLPEHHASLVLLDAERERIEAQSPEAPASGVGPQNLAYVIYTSGSTGRPKGVMVPHGGLANVVRAQGRELGLGACERVLQFASPSFDASVFELVMALCSGAALCVGPREGLLPGAEMVAWLREQRVTAATLTPSTVAALPEGASAALPQLRTLMTAGEACSQALVEEWAGERRFFNLYGPTETTIWASASRCVPGGVRPTIGRPIGNTRLYVLDAGGAPVPVGVAGELYVGGVGVTRGYLGRAELTAERFVPDAFGGDAGARLYRTGDRVRWLATGELDFLGRTDAQVKVRGFRVEPGEVEAVLSGHPGVREVVVLAREQRLVAYVVGPAALAGGSLAELRGWARARLPEHLVPGAFVALEALPQTPGGKLDVRGLPAPEQAGSGAAYEAPRTGAEREVARVWAEVLGVERVGRGEHFFERGGHSLLATRVVSRLRDALGVEVPLRALFEAPVLEEFAARVEALVGSGSGMAAPPLVPVSRAGGPLALSYAQQRLWFIHRLTPGSAAYNIPVALRLRGALEVPVLERALTELVRRHETLRTVFVEDEGEPVQVVREAAPLRLAVEDLRGVPAESRPREAGRLAGEEALRAFDLGSEGPLRVRVLRLEEAEWAVLFTVHHIASDGWSMGVLVREVSELYEAFSGGREPRLPELPVQYADYAAWQRAYLRGATLEGQLSYWRDRLGGAPPLLEVPTDRPRAAGMSDRGGSRALSLSAGLTEALRELGRAEGATPFMVLVAAWQLLLARYSGQEDVVVGSPVAGRTRTELEGLIGFFVNTLALRTDLSGDPTFRELLGRVREGVVDGQAHQEVPFERLVEELGVERSLTHTPLFQAMFAYQGEGVGEVRMGGLEVLPLGSGAAPAKFDLSLSVQEAEGALVGELSYRAELWEGESIERMLEHLRELLGSAAADPGRRISALSMLSHAERRQVVDEWNATAADYPRDRCMHQLVAEQVARTPHAAALVSGSRTVTYAELEAGASRIARQLRALGIGPEARVGICLERSAEMVAAVLGVLKTGGAYVPLDPTYPAERLAYMLADSGAAVLLTQESLRALVPGFHGSVVCLDAADGGAGGEPAGTPHAEAVPENPAYVIYTSGSTGRPKGVLVTHRSLVNYTHAAARLFGLGPADRVLQFASFSFDTSAEEIFPTLLAGATLVLRDPGPLEGPAAFLERMGDRGVTVLDLPTAYWHEMVAGMERGTAGIPACVRLVVIGGEHASPERVAAWHARIGGRVRLLNSYGPTETTVVATLAELTGVGADRRAAVPIGSPVPNARAYVLDAALQAVPAGVRGELYVAGDGLARGYLDRAGPTAERFLPDPFSAVPGGRMYRTGDVVRRRGDGALEFLGRVDGQVKVRGFRIELGEVESALLRDPAVRDAVVVVREDEPGRAMLVGYVVPETAAPDTAALRARLRAELPEHMVPSVLVVLEALPLTPGGKTDRRALPAPERGGSGEAYVAPATAAEREIARIWGEVLGIESVGLHDNFFELGGNSLLLLRVQAGLRSALGREVPVIDLFRFPSVALLAGALSAAEGAGAAAAPVEAEGRAEEREKGKQRLGLLRGRQRSGRS